MPLVYNTPGGSGGVTSVTAADTSIVVGGTASAPTVRTGTLDVIAADHAPAADWSNNSHKITSLANGSAASDAAAFGQITAANAAAIQNDGWISTTDTWTFATSSTFTISGVDRTAVLTPGTRVKLTQTTAKFFVVTASSFSTNTTVTVTGGSDYSLANASITSPFYSYVANPQGYPGWFNASASPTGFSSISNNSTRFAVVGRTMTVQFIYQGTSNATTFTFTLPVALSASAIVQRVFARAIDNNTALTTPGVVELAVSSSTATCDINAVTNGGWTASGTKGLLGVLTYEI